jgi:hypothetical protein
MNLRLVSAALFLASAILFLVVGLRAEPRNYTFVALAALFGAFAVVRFRSSRRP